MLTIAVYLDEASLPCILLGFTRTNQFVLGNGAQDCFHLFSAKPNAEIERRQLREKFTVALINEVPDKCGFQIESGEEQLRSLFEDREVLRDTRNVIFKILDFVALPDYLGALDECENGGFRHGFRSQSLFFNSSGELNDLDGIEEALREVASMIAEDTGSDFYDSDDLPITVALANGLRVDDLDRPPNPSPVSGAASHAGKAPDSDKENDSDAAALDKRISEILVELEQAEDAADYDAKAMKFAAELDVTKELFLSAFADVDGSDDDAASSGDDDASSATSEDDDADHSPASEAADIPGSRVEQGSDDHVVIVDDSTADDSTADELFAREQARQYQMMVIEMIRQQLAYQAAEEAALQRAAEDQLLAEIAAERQAAEQAAAEQAAAEQAAAEQAVLVQIAAQLTDVEKPEAVRHQRKRIRDDFEEDVQQQQITLFGEQRILKKSRDAQDVPPPRAEAKVASAEVPFEASKPPRRTRGPLMGEIYRFIAPQWHEPKEYPPFNEAVAEFVDFLSGTTSGK
jgi:hypothetical protein